MPSDFFSEFKEIFHSGHYTSSFTHSRIMFIEFLSSPFASHHLCPVRLRKNKIISIDINEFFPNCFRSGSYQNIYLYYCSMLIE